MAATIEKAEAEDPKALRARVAQLEREIAAARRTAPAPAKDSLELAREEGRVDVRPA